MRVCLASSLSLPPVSRCLIFLRFEYGWLMVFRGLETSVGALERGLGRARIVFCRETSGAELTLFITRLARIYGRKYHAREERRQESTKLAERIFWGVILPIWHFDVTLLSSYLSEWNELFLSSPRRHRTYIESIGVAEKNLSLSLSLSKVIETECVVHPASIVL